jgi:hypothetical protein
MSEILDVLHQREESAIAPAAMDGGRRKIPVP